MALARRKKVLKKMGIKRAKRKHNKLVANVKIEGLEGLEPASRSRLRCLVCREGYDYKPNEMLGLYVYNKEVELAFDPDEGGEDIGLTTVTHFNTIHFSCHAKAVRADASLKTPKREWDGAAIRNSHTLCNNLFPIRSPFDDAVEYADRVDAYWRNISFRGSFRNSRAAVVLEDLRLLLARFAYEESFAEFTKGGGEGVQHQICAVPDTNGPALCFQALTRTKPNNECSIRFSKPCAILNRAYKNGVRILLMCPSVF